VHVCGVSGGGGRGVLHAGAGEGVQYAGDGPVLALKGEGQLLHVRGGLGVQHQVVAPHRPAGDVVQGVLPDHPVRNSQDFTVLLEGRQAQ